MTGEQIGVEKEHAKNYKGFYRFYPKYDGVGQGSFLAKLSVAGSKSEYAAKLRGILTKVHNLA